MRTHDKRRTSAFPGVDHRGLFLLQNLGRNLARLRELAEEEEQPERRRLLRIQAGKLASLVRELERAL